MATYILTEDGFHLLLEDGDDLLLEEMEVSAGSSGCGLLNEDGGFSLLEDGGAILLEGCPAEVVTEPTGGGYGARLDANSRRARLRTIIRDDDDLMALI